jgi:hypothetical protein
MLFYFIALYYSDNGIDNKVIREEGIPKTHGTYKE